MSEVIVSPVSVLKSLRAFAVVFAFLMVYAVLPAPAHAAGPTQEQVQAVITLLSTFGTDQSTLANVELALRGVSRDELLRAIMIHGNGSTTNTVGPHNQINTEQDRVSSSTRPHDEERPTDDNRIRPFGGVSSTSPSVSRPVPAMCNMLARSLRRGDTGDDVNQLQNFLQRTGDLAVGSTTGYFGGATEHALQQWQIHEGVATSGTATSSGLGFLGPKTRSALIERCKDLHDQNGEQASSTSPFGTENNTGPVCTLKASQAIIEKGTEVTLTWDSKNATYSSSATGEQGPVSGSIIVTPEQTTTYLKKVYNDAGAIGQCIRTVVVKNTMPIREKKVVESSSINIGHIFSLMGDGMAAVMDGYLSLFGMSLQ